MPGAREAIATLCRLGMPVYLATNQSGIGRGIMSLEQLQIVHGRMTEELSEVGARLNTIFYCPHAPDDDCSCRKPAPGMLHSVMEHGGFESGRMLFIGDMPSDRGAAEAAGCLFAEIRDGRTLEIVVQELVGSKVAGVNA